MDVKPEIVAVCDSNLAMTEWFGANCTTVRQATADYRELLSNPRVEAVYAAVPHNLHTEIYSAAIAAGKPINTLETMRYRPGGEQAWQVRGMGHEMAFKSLTGVNFEAGFSDSILQMWAAFLHELAHGAPKSRFAGCVTRAEAALSHRLFTAALESQAHGTTVAI